MKWAALCLVVTACSDAQVRGGDAGVDAAPSDGNIVVDALTDALVDAPAPFDANEPAPWLEEDFSTYASTSQMLADPRGIYSVTEDVATSQMTLDTSVGVTSLGLTQSMRYDFPDRTSEGGSGTTGRCTDYTIGRNITLPAPVPDVWIEVIARFDPSFTTVAPSAWGCTSAAAYKFVFGRTQTSRFNLVLAIFGGEYTFGWPANSEPADWPETWNAFDGAWHQYRMHFKVSTPSTAANGAAELWVDGVALQNFTNIVESNPAIYGIALGRNMNQGPGAAESMWWGRVRAWNADPLW